MGTQGRQENDGNLYDGSIREGNVFIDMDSRRISGSSLEQRQGGEITGKDYRQYNQNQENDIMLSCNMNLGKNGLTEGEPFCRCSKAGAISFL